jgi:quinol monooxygenase YgiN
MIVVLTEMRFAPDADGAMRDLVPDVERFCRHFDGCERFDVSFPADRPGILFTTETWRDARALRAHLAIAHHAAELEKWHALVKDMMASVFRASGLELAELLREEVAS